MVRLFVALPLPDQTRQHLMLISGGLSGARWVKPENLHLTLRFVGEVDGGTARDIDDALSRVSVPPFSVTLSGVGVFGTDKPRVLWAGVERNPALIHLRDRIESALVRTGLEPDRQKYAPHVTLAHLKGIPPARLTDYLASYQGLRTQPLLVDRFILYSSFLQTSGPIYTPEAEYLLEP